MSWVARTFEAIFTIFGYKIYQINDNWIAKIIPIASVVVLMFELLRRFVSSGGRAAQRLPPYNT